MPASVESSSVFFFPTARAGIVNIALEWGIDMRAYMRLC